MSFSSRRKLLFALLLLAPLVASVTTSKPAAAGGEKEYICHYQPGRDAWKKIRVTSRATARHFQRHDDGYPGDITAISNTPLDEDCLAAPNGHVGRAKISVCHYQPDEDAWKKIDIGPSAVDAHLDHHDDALPGDLTSISGTPMDSFCEETEPPCGDCLMAEPAQMGCQVPECEMAVCAQDSFCCNVNWDPTCEAEAADLCVMIPNPPLCRP